MPPSSRPEKLPRQPPALLGLCENMLDHIGVHTLLDIDSCARLFDTHRHLVHYTSALRYPVFVDGLNYSGSPAMLSRSSLRRQVETHLAEEIRVLGPQCL